MKNKYRILMFAPNFAPYCFSESIVSGKLALAMIHNGWHVDIISDKYEGRKYGDQWVEPWRPLRPYTHEIEYTFANPLTRFAQRIMDSVVMRHPIPKVRWARRALAKAIELHQENNYHFIFSRSVSDHAHLPAMIFKRRFGIPWIANWNDPPAYHFPPPYSYTIPNVQRKIWDRYFRNAADEADFNTFPCERLAQYMIEPLGLKNRHKVRIIPHIGLEGYGPTSVPTNGVFSLCHAGNLSPERTPVVLLKALRMFLDKVNPPEPVHMKIVGVENISINKMLNDLNLTDISSFTGPVDYLESLEQLSASTVAVIVEAPCDVGIFMPGKLADYVSTGRPVLSLSPREGTIRDVISECGGGVVVDCTSVERTYEGLVEMYHCWREGKLEKYLSADLQQLLSPKNALANYEGLFKELRSDSKRLLIVTGTFPPRSLVGGLRPAMFAKYLPEFGWETYVLTREWPADDLAQNCKMEIPGLPPEENIHRITISKQNEIQSIVERRSIDKFMLMIHPEMGHPPGVAEKMMKISPSIWPEKKFDAILATMPDLWTLRVARELSCLRGIPWVADLRDIYEQEKGIHGSLRDRFLHLRLKLRRDRLLSSASLVLTVSDWHARIMRTKISCKVEPLLNGYDPDLFMDPKLLPLTKKFRISYMGRILNLWYRDPSLFFKAVDMLLERKVIGKDEMSIDFYGAENELLREIIRNHSCASMINIQPRVNHDEVINILRQSTVLLSLMNKGRRGILTTKIFEYLPVGRPILHVLGDEAELDQILNDTGAGISCHSIEEVISTLEDWIGQWRLTGMVRSEARSEKIDNYSRKNQAQLLAGLLGQVVRDHSNHTG